MKKLNDIFFSMATTIVLLVIFAASIGYATFAENSSGTEYAREIVYNAKWFEVLLILLIVNLLGSIVRYKILNKRKFSVLLFHLSFILILIGAGITRYFGSEGIMHLRQGETSNEISSDKTSVKITAEYNGQKVEKTTEASFSETGSNDFSEELEIGGKKLNIESELFVPNSVETVVPDDQGEPTISLFVMNQENQGMDFILSKGESNQFEGVGFTFADSTKKSDINFSISADQLYFNSTLPLAKMGMMEKEESMVMPGILTIAQEKTIYKTEKLLFVVKTYIPKAKKILTQYTPEMNKSGIMIKGKNAIIFNVSDGNTTRKVNVLSAEDQVSQPGICLINGVKVSIAYGVQPHKLPFSITLREFQLDRYPGSNSPSSYASEITVTDNEMKTVRPFRIYMNNILNYRGYRFFQSSYDTDEKGTILSVNHDYWGTLVTYIGYFFMLIGMAWTLFNKNSRFHTIIKLSNNLQQRRKATKTLLLAGLLAATGTLSAAGNDKKAHIDALGSLLIQDEVQGRVEPISTYASDLFRKISKKTSYKNESALEVVLGMSTNPSHWQNEPIIKIAHEGLAKELGAINGYVSFNQLFDFENGGQYRISGKVDAVYQKDPSQRNQYEKELMNVDERVNITNSILSGSILTIFPVSGHENEKWLSAANFKPTHTSSSKGTTDACCPATGMSGKPANSGSMDGNELKCPVTGKTGKAKELNSAMTEMTGKSDTVCPIHGNMNNASAAMTAEKMPAGLSDSSVESIPQKLLSTYFAAVLQANESGDWSFANSALANLKNYQLLNGGVQLPSKSKVKFEVLYNKLSIFLTLAILYGLIGFILIGLHLINILKFNPKIDRYLNKSIYPLFIIFLAYTAGLSMRWYISGHAPWSNGYESMLFVGWATGLCGLVFARRSPITLAITLLLVAIALSVAGMSWMNPEITNLVPVLKSYWLVIHVAVITSSYGFFATASMLALFNLCLMVLRSDKNKKRLNDSIEEFSYIVELALIIGLFMLTVGTFLGGIWANESWGRYWGWDSKETWALVSVLVYSVILHLRNIPKANNPLLFNTVSLLSFSTVMMTYFGVNYYLSGMHSYGQGTPPPIPPAVYFTVAGIILLVTLAFNSEKKYKKKL
ncbi:MAG: cytochrome c biogenesis protein CcsA [Paludibacter sp.]